MKKMLKKSGLLLAAAIVCLALLSACSKKEPVPADQIATAFYKLMISGDPAEAQTVLGYSDEDVNQLLTLQKSGSVKTIKANLSGTGLYEATDEDAGAMYQTQIDAFKNLTCTAEVTAEEKDTATVVLKTNYYDIAALDTQAAEEAIEEYGAENVSDEESAKQLIQLYVQKFDEIVKAAAPSGDQKEITIEFEKQKVDVNGKAQTMWIPKEAEKFGSDLINAVSGV